MGLSNHSSHYESKTPTSATAESDVLGKWRSQKMAAEELLQRYASGERDFRGVNLSDEILIWADLQGADLSGAKLRGANLNWANLSRVDLTAADLTGADMAWANLNKADLRGANLSGADLSGADFSKADWSWAIMPDGTILPVEDSSLASKFFSWLVNTVS